MVIGSLYIPVMAFPIGDSEYPPWSGRSQLGNDVVGRVLTGESLYERKASHHNRARGTIMVETLAVIIVVVWIIRTVNAHDARVQSAVQTPPANTAPVPAMPSAPALAWVIIGGVRYITYTDASGTRVLVKG